MHHTSDQLFAGLRACLGATTVAPNISPIQTNGINNPASRANYYSGDHSTRRRSVKHHMATPGPLVLLISQVLLIIDDGRFSHHENGRGAGSYAQSRGTCHMGTCQRKRRGLGLAPRRMYRQAARRSETLSSCPLTGVKLSAQSLAYSDGSSSSPGRLKLSRSSASNPSFNLAWR